MQAADLGRVWALDHACPLQQLNVDNVSESRSMADGGSLRSVAQMSARSLSAVCQTNMALYQVMSSATKET